LLTILISGPTQPGVDMDVFLLRSTFLNGGCENIVGNRCSNVG
jgi:hypothetical protein